jgi:hypothetical protein
MNGNRESTNQNAGTDMGAYATLSSPFHMKDPDLTEEAQSCENKGNGHVAEPIQKENVPLSTDCSAAQMLQELGHSSSDVISSNYDDPLIEKLDLGDVSRSESLVEDNVRGDFINTINSTTGIVKQAEETHIQKENETICTEFDESQESQESNYATGPTNFYRKNPDAGEISQVETLGVDNEIFRGDCIIGGADEENPDPDFLSELQGTQDKFGFKWTQDEFAAEANDSLEIIGSSLDSYLPYSKDPYKWTPDELKAATGSEDCTFVEHGLKLRSVYTDVEACFVIFFSF